MRNASKAKASERVFMFCAWLLVVVDRTHRHGGENQTILAS